MRSKPIGTEGSGKIRSYRDLIAWQKAMDLVCLTYKVTAKLPSEERFGLKADMRRSAVSVPSNIAEGQGRAHLGEYLHDISIANGSLKELKPKS